MRRAFANRDGVEYIGRHRLEKRTDYFEFAKRWDHWFAQLSKVFQPCREAIAALAKDCEKRRQERIRDILA